MPRLHVSLPQDLYDELRNHGWSPSELLREAVRERLRLEQVAREREEWYQELVATFGPPTAEELAIVDRLVRNTVGEGPEQ
jgi:Arc/MetJ-type ribon-helix-helix transcriptional regulator